MVSPNWQILLSRSLMTSFERSFSKLSENHKIVDIGSTDSTKVMAVERIPKPMIKSYRGGVVEHL